VDDEGRVKIAIFGIARIEASELTQTGVMMGSPGTWRRSSNAAAQMTTAPISLPRA